MIICDYCKKEIKNQKPISYETCLMEDGSGIDGGEVWDHFHKKCVERLDSEVVDFVNEKLTASTSIKRRS